MSRCLGTKTRINREETLVVQTLWHALDRDGFEVVVFIVQGRVKHTFGEGLVNEGINEAGDFIYIDPGVPHAVFNIGDEPLIAFVARSTADEWDKIVNYPSQYRPKE